MDKPFFGENIKEAITVIKEAFMKKCAHCKKTECKHENVEYCPCCQKVVCKDCGEMWEKPSSPIWIQPYVVPNELPIYPYTPYWDTDTVTYDITNMIQSTPTH